MTAPSSPDAHIGSLVLPADRIWRRWVENPFAFFYVPLGVATALLLFFPGHSWAERGTGAVVAALTAAWFHLWRRNVRTDPEGRGLARRLAIALVGIALASILAVVHDAYLVVLLMLIPQFFMTLPIGWCVALTVLVAFPTGRLYDTHGQVPDFADTVVSVLLLRVPVMVMFGIVVRTAASQNEERRRLQATLAAAERRAGVLEERQRLSREIHDTLAQGFAAILVHLDQADDAAGGGVGPHLAFARSVARENLEEARRMMGALRPEVLDQEGALPAALARVCGEWGRRTGVPCALAVTGTVLPLHSEAEVMLLRATQELLANVGKHAGARHVAVTLSYMSDVVALDVRDDGVGFVEGTTAEPLVVGRAASGGFGLHGLRERTRLLGGTMDVESAPGEGATATLTIPAFRTDTYAVPAVAAAIAAHTAAATPAAHAP